MQTIFPSAAVLRQNYALVSALRAQGFAIGAADKVKPMPGDLFMIVEGEAPPV
jgi:two-component system, response regulator FlrC